MTKGRMKQAMSPKLCSGFLAAAFCVCVFLFSGLASAQTHNKAVIGKQTKGENAGKFDVAKFIMEDILDRHEFHLTEVNGKPVTIPLPVILYSPQRGLSSFISSKFEHGHAVYNRYKMINGKVVAVDESGTVDTRVKVYDFSITRNVMQMIFSAILLFAIMRNIAKRYKKTGSNAAPTGFQNAIETVIAFIREEVAKPNLGHKYQKYMPYLLGIFFFILINNLIGLIPASAKVSSNIAFTFVLALISLVAILLSSNRYFWSHIFNPPDMPFLVKLILVPVEFAGIFIKPAALMIRLFANMIAGHIIIICFISLIFIFSAINIVAGVGFIPVSIVFTIFIFLLEILVAFIQAFIFTNLTAVFVGQAFETGHEHKKRNDPQPNQPTQREGFAL